MSIQSAAQLSLTAMAESVDIQSRVQGAAAFCERDIWLDASRFSSEVIKEAKNLPMPAGSLDSEGSLVKPSMLGDKFSNGGTVSQVPKCVLHGPGLLGLP